MFSSPLSVLYVLSLSEFAFSHSFLRQCANNGTLEAFLQPVCLFHEGPMANASDSEEFVVQRYERIRLAEQEDLDRLYPLLRAYALDPSLADTVKEVHIDEDGWASPCYSCLSGEESENEADIEINDEAQRALEDVVKHLGLDFKSEDEMITALYNERRIVVGAWTLPPEKRDAHRRSFGYAATSILLFLCRNIDTVALGKLNRDHMLHRFLTLANYGLLAEPIFPNLKEARLLGYDLDERMYSYLEICQYMQYFHRLPSVETIIMDAVQEYQMWQTYFVPFTGSMRRIHMTHADASPEALSTIISVPKALEELKISFGGLWSRDGGSPLMSYGRISKELLEHKDTLRLLDMDLEVASHFPPYRYTKESDSFVDNGKEDDEWSEPQDAIEYDNMQRELYGTEYIDMDKKAARPSTVSQEAAANLKYSHIASFKDFNVLTHLSISITIIVSPEQSKRLIDSLPTSLEHLCFYGYKRGKHELIDSNVDELVAKMADRLPNLKEVRGIEEFVPGLEQIYGHEAEEGNMPKKQTGMVSYMDKDVDWKEVV